jgi:hypothetical protein
VVGEKELPLEDWVVMRHAYELLVIRVHYRPLKEESQALPQNGLQSWARHALSDMVQVF